MKRSNAFLFSLAVVACSCIGNAAIAADTTNRAGLNIGAQPLSRALLDFSEQTGLQIGYAADLASGKVTEGVEGIDDPGVALARILVSTGLEYEFVNHETVVIRAAAPASQAAPEDLGDSPPVFELMLMASLQQPAEQAQSDEEEQEADDDDAVVEEPVELEKQVVTGSRMQGGDPSARVYSFSAEDIAVRGVSSLEEFFRTLPWAFPSITTQTNMSYDTPGSRYANGSDSRDEKWAQLGLGVSTVNLRALGSANTLVLVNGRRIAGKAGEEDDFANLLTMPLSAIERVDIQLDGASAVYGSDAIGGVVNFITKRNYRGLSVDYRNEFSSTDADITKASVTGGYAWGSGSVTAILSRDTADPITNAKTGWSSSDFRDYLGPEFDLRSKSNSQPGVVCELHTLPWSLWNFQCAPSWMNLSRYQLPADHGGAGAIMDDFIVIPAGEQPPTLLDWVSPQNGAESTTESITVNLEQYITDDLRVYLDFQRSTHEAYQEHDLYIGGVIPVPASNAYNSFGRSVGVLYTPLREFQEGSWPVQFTESETTQRNLNFGIIWTFSDSHELSLEATRTESEREAYRLQAKTKREPWDPTADAFYEALSSSDPNRAINPFGNGTDQGASFADFLTLGEGPVKGDSEKRTYNFTLRGDLFRLWGGPVSYSAGAERREEFIFRTVTHTNRFTVEPGYLVDNLGDDIGVDRPSRETSAYYVEFALPLIGPENARPGVESLILTLQARRDVYDSDGAQLIQTRSGYLGYDVIPVEVPYWHPDEGWTSFFRDTYKYNYEREEHDLNITNVKNSRTSPRVGLRFQPVSTFTMRGSWSRSFRPPVWSDQFSATDSGLHRARRYTSPYFDPYAPGGPAQIRAFYVISSYNPTLKSEYSDNYSLGFDWSPEAIPGLNWTVDWFKVDFTNKIESSSSFIQSRPELVFNNPDIVERDEEGNAVQVSHWPVNLDEKYSEIVDTTLQYTFDTAFGNFTSGISYTRVLQEYMRITPGAPKVTDLGTQNGSNKYKLQGSLTWLWDNFAADVFVYYTPAYMNDGALYCTWYTRQIPGNRCGDKTYLELPVSSLTTVDLTLTYRMDNGLRVRVGGRNILDRGAPRTLFGSTYPYDPTRWDARGQVLFIDLNWEM